VNPSDQRISLSEAAGQPGTRRHLRRGHSAEVDGQGPTERDLAEAVQFSPSDGRIWLNDQRMLLFPSATLARLRDEMAEALGEANARAAITRIGYAQGARDAQLVRSRWPDRNLTHWLSAGPRIHTLEGFVNARTLSFTYDVEHGHYDGEFVWNESSEADEYLASHGVSPTPVCWMQVAYATGYASWLMGRLVLFRELECRAQGHAQCRLAGRTLALWGRSVDEIDLRTLAAAPGGASPAARMAAKRAEAAAATGPAIGPTTDAPPAPSPTQATGANRAPSSAPAGAASSGQRPTLVGVSASFTAARHRLERVAATHATALLVGESGVGKELFARRLHDLSPRHAGPFVAVNCAAIPDTLVEAELFGVERGAFTGATATRPGRFERAAGGTLFLDEVASLSAVAQGKLLRAIQEREIERVGGTATIPTDVRVVAATNTSLREAVRAGLFREDLYFRLNVLPIELPPLRERRDDIPLLMDHFLALYSSQHGRRIAGFTRRAIDALLHYDYPGNLREMQNLIERGVVFAEADGLIDTVHLFRGELRQERGLSPDPLGQLRPAGEASDETQAGPATDPPDGLPLHEIERRLYADAMQRCGGSVSAAARRLGLTRSQLDYRLRKTGLLPQWGRRAREER
jgi:two-component system, NtrC family, response regulator HydG